VERLRLVGGRPMSLQLSYLPAEIGDEVAKADLAVTPLRQVLAFKLGIDITGARESISAVSLDARAARELGCRRGAAAFRSDRVSLDAAGAAIVYDRVFIPGDRFRITRQLEYSGGPRRPDEPQRGEEAKPPTHGASQSSKLK
jgi:GntR family transcriptional regulator